MCLQVALLPLNTYKLGNVVGLSGQPQSKPRRHPRQCLIHSWVSLVQSSAQRSQPAVEVCALPSVLGHKPTEHYLWHSLPPQYGGTPSAMGNAPM